MCGCEYVWEREGERERELKRHRECVRHIYLLHYPPKPLFTVSNLKCSVRILEIFVIGICVSFNYMLILVLLSHYGSRYLF